MITLERLRLVNWHYFEDTVIEIGNRCLLAGDNGSGKSTIIDAIQYVMAANLRMARFNSAADERRGGGRDLMGYARCKLGSESTEYRRGDTVSHVMLQGRCITDTGAGRDFSCGVCIEAFKDNHYTEHFWTGPIAAGPAAIDDSIISIKEINVRNEKKELLNFRQFKNTLAEKNIYNHPTKREYIRDLTNRLGVFKRQPDINPYLDSLTRSIGFKPLD
jgi:energy-coupling factor transporter ATP-binding protein EcfA2